MTFRRKYEITTRYLTKDTKRRSGKLMQRVGFLVAHDTGNKGSTATGNIDWYERTSNDQSASAHIFVDDKGIYECIPFLTESPEKAWHVLYNKALDNQIYGDDANDIGGGIEYCYGNNINADEAYKRYIWILAYSCFRFGLDPTKAIVGHFRLDPQRKTDPESGLRASGRTYKQLLDDVVKEYYYCLEEVEVLKFDYQWQWDMLTTALLELYDQKYLTSEEWISKARDKKLTTSELIFINTILLKRHLMPTDGE